MFYGLLDENIVSWLSNFGLIDCAGFRGGQTSHNNHCWTPSTPYTFASPYIVADVLE